MIRTNLSTRPFYNEGQVRAWLLALAVLVAAATVFNVSRVLHYSGSETELALQASRDEARAWTRAVGDDIPSVRDWIWPA